MFTEETVTLPARSLNWPAATIIEHSTTRLIPNAGSDEFFVTGLISCVSNDDFAQVKTDAEKLAKVLKACGPENLTPALLSWSRDARERHLRQQLLQHPRVSLNSVLGVAQQLASAVSSVYTCRFTHKNIRPETILLFPDKVASDLRAFLLGVDSLQSGDTAWERNLYRHPTRQGLHVNDKHIMQHDIYSMGVSLLELGLWESFVQYGSEGAMPSTPLELTLDDLIIADCDFESRTKVKDHLITIARSKSPRKVGKKYAAVVITCLTCLDEDNGDFGEEEDMRDKDGIQLGMRYLEKVLNPLLELSA
ncbi:hypothetical protein B0J14DRAFT_675380 [Halenospora varia]|nr:hypothetical protein B0J14DRAFT_675380 [Halenospora varia]